MTLDIETGSGPVERRVTLRGRLDSLTAPKLDAELASILGTPAVTSLVFQLEGLDYISSAGIRSILRARKAIEGRGGRVAIVNPQPSVLKVFEIVKALPADQVFASEAELDAYLARQEARQVEVTVAGHARGQRGPVHEERTGALEGMHGRLDGLR